MMEAMDDGRVCADCQDRPFETAGVEKKNHGQKGGQKVI